MTDPATGATLDLLLQPMSQLSTDRLRRRQRRHPDLRLQQPAPADQRHAQDLRRDHGRVDRLRVRPDGNLTSKTTTGFAGAASNTYTYDEANRLTSWNNGTTTTRLRLRQRRQPHPGRADQTYTYDARDELTTDGTGTYSYTARGTLGVGPVRPGSVASPPSTPTATRPPPGTQSYAYDAPGPADVDTTAGRRHLRVLLRRAPPATLASDGTSAPTPGTRPAAPWPAPARPAAGRAGSLALTDAHSDRSASSPRPAPAWPGRRPTTRGAPSPPPAGA